MIPMRHSSDGHPLHPAHSQFHLLRLLVGSIIGGWSIMLVFIALGFLGTIDFVDSIDLAVRWILIGGSIIGVIIGVVFALLAALLVNIVPTLKQSLHPLALVRAGFLIIIIWPLVALAFWPMTMWGHPAAPVVAILIAWAGVRTNPHAELVPHSTIGRGLGTAVGPAILLAFLLIILVPMFHRGYGSPEAPKLIMLAVAGIDGPYASQVLHSPASERYPNLLNIEETGGYGMLNSDRPIIAARLWGSIMTGEKADEHGILDRNSTADDLESPSIWEILSIHGYTVGLFQAPPPHCSMEDAAYDIPVPGEARALSDPAARFIENIRAAGRNQSLPLPFELGFTAYSLARLGVKLETIAALGNEYLYELIMRPSPRLVYARRKLLEFRIDTDRALSMMRKNPADVAILRFDSLEPLLMEYWRYARPDEFAAPPADVDTALACGLGYVVPDAYRELDKFIGDIEPFRNPETVLAIVSNHGIRSASDLRYKPMQLSPDGFISATRMSDTIVGDISSEGICLRPASEGEDLELLNELDGIIVDAEWELPDEPESARRTRAPFNTTMHEHCLEVTIPNAPDLSPAAIITMGDWTGPLADLLIDTDPPSGRIAGNALLLVAGQHFREGQVARNPQVYDITPTLLYSLGVPVSEEFDGRVMDELFDPAWMNRNPVEYVSEYSFEQPAEEVSEEFQPSVAPGEGIEE